MSTLDELTGVPARSAAIRMVVREAFDLGEPMTPANIGLKCQRFNEFGELGADELAAAVAEIEQPATEAQAEPADTSSQEVEPLPTMTIDELNEATKQNVNAQVVARRIVLDSQQEQRQAKNAFTNACIAFERGGKPITREQLQRETIAANQAYKQGLKDGTIEPPRLPGRGPSVIDQYAGSANGGDASQFVRKRMRHGSHHRPVWINGKCYAVGQRTTHKLPSER